MRKEFSDGRLGIMKGYLTQQLQDVRENEKLELVMAKDKLFTETECVGNLETSGGMYVEKRSFAEAVCNCEEWIWERLGVNEMVQKYERFL